MRTAVIDNSPAVLTDLVELVDRDPACEDSSGVRELIAAQRRVLAWVDAYGVKLARRTRQLADAARPSGAPTGTSGVVASLLASGVQSGKDAKTATAREAICSDLPGFEDALSEGAISGAHVDALGNAARNLTDEERAELRDRAGELLDHARGEFAETFDKTARNIVNEIRDRHRAHAADDELETQRKASKVTEWTDQATGMNKFLVELDPVRAAKLRNAIVTNLAHLRQQPDNTNKSYDELRVEALLLAVTNPAERPGLARVPEISVLIDWKSLRDGVLAAGGICELADGTPLPVATLRQMACNADIIPVVLGGHGEVLDVGRARRLATHTQRIALRAMYATCPEPGCDRPVEHGRAHHVTPWDPNAGNGPTDLANLLLVCEPTHTRIHQGDLTVQIIGNHEELIWTRRDGTIIRQGHATNRHPQPP